MKYKSNHCIIGKDCIGDYILHHVKTRGSFGSDESSNLMPLCIYHHNLIHAHGLKAFTEKYTEAFRWLQQNGWEIDLMGKWRNYGK